MMRLLGPILCCCWILLSFPSKGQRRRATPATSPAAEQPVAILPFTFSGHHLIVKAAISGLPDSLSLIFDSGAEVTILHKGMAETLKLTALQGKGVSATNNMMLQMQTATLSTLYMGNIRVPFLKVYIENLQEFRQGTIKADGIIGVDLLKQYIVTIDYANRQLRLYRNGNTPTAIPGQRLPMKLNYVTPVLNATIQLPGGQSLTGNYHLTTGGDYGILFNWPYTDAHHLNEILPTIDTDRVQDMLRVLTYINSAIPLLSISNAQFRQVPVSYCKDINDDGAFMEVAGSIGFQIWKQCVLTINYNKKEIVLQQQ